MQQWTKYVFEILRQWALEQKYPLRDTYNRFNETRNQKMVQIKAYFINMLHLRFWHAQVIRI